MKRNNSRITTLLICGLFIASMTACDQACTHADANGDGRCDECGAALSTESTTERDSETEPATEAPLAEVEVSVTIRDQDGNPMEGVTVSIVSADELSTKTAVTDAEGHFTTILTEGTYTVNYDVLPEYVIGIKSTLTVTPDMAPVELEVTDNTPIGTEDRPFVVSEERVSSTIPAGATYYFTMFGANNRCLIVENTTLEATFNGTTYTPDENGNLSVRLVTDDPRAHVLVALTNKGSEAQEITILLQSDPGAMDNPIEITALGEIVTANVPQDGMLYYTWTATESGTLTVTSADTINNISLNNLATSRVTDFTNGEASVSLDVHAGDVITVVVSVIGGDKSAEYNTVTFSLAMGEESAA